MIRDDLELAIYCIVTSFVIETSFKTSVYIPKRFANGWKKQERSIIKRMTRILLSDEGLKGMFLKLNIQITKTAVACFFGHHIK